MRQISECSALEPKTSSPVSVDIDAIHFISYGFYNASGKSNFIVFYAKM